MRRVLGLNFLIQCDESQTEIIRFLVSSLVCSWRDGQNRSTESEVTTSRYSSNCERDHHAQHDPPSPGWRPLERTPPSRTDTALASTPHVSARPHGRGHPGAPCRPLGRATETRANYPSAQFDAAVRNMSGNAGAAAPRNGLAAGRTATSAENRRNIVERASGGGKGQGIIVDPR